MNFKNDFTQKTNNNCLISIQTAWANSSLTFIDKANKLFIGLLNQKAFYGGYAFNPLKFSSFFDTNNDKCKIKSVKLFLNSSDLDGLTIPEDQSCMYC